MAKKTQTRKATTHKKHRYDATCHGVMKWAKHELGHVGRIVAVEDPDIQYSYALSTVNGMIHLKQAIEELVADPDYKQHRKDLLKTHGQVVRTIHHLIKDFKVDLKTIKAFNTRHILRNVNSLQTRKNVRFDH